MLTRKLSLSPLSCCLHPFVEKLASRAGCRYIICAILRLERNLRILRMHNVILRLRKFSDCVEHIYCNRILLSCKLISYGANHCLVCSIIRHLAYFGLQGAWPFCACIKSHDLYHASESSLKLILESKLHAMLPEPQRNSRWKTTPSLMKGEP